MLSPRYHRQWNEFARRLSRELISSGCSGSLAASIAILHDMEGIDGIDVVHTIKGFHACRAFCDCQVLTAFPDRPRASKPCIRPRAEPLPQEA
jgi:hypothetical protein